MRILLNCLLLRENKLNIIMHPKNYHVKVLIYLRKPGCNIISSSVTPTLGL